MTTLLAVAIGSALGAPCRYLVDWFVQLRHDGAFPWGTWVVNVSGSFLLGLLLGSGQPRGLDLMLVTSVATGFLGSYTTFSTFAWDTLRLAEDGAVVTAGLNVVLSLGVGLGAALAGLAVGTVW